MDIRAIEKEGDGGWRAPKEVVYLILYGYFLTLFSILLIGDFFFSFPTDGSFSIEPLLFYREDFIFDTHPRLSFFELFSLSKLS